MKDNNLEFPILEGYKGYSKIRFFHIEPDLTLVLVEYPPSFRKILFGHSTLWLEYFTYPFRMKLVFPYVYLAMTFQKNSDGMFVFLDHSMHAFYGCKPLEKTSDDLYLTNLPHTYPKGFVCMHFGIQGKNLETLTHRLLDVFWSGRFGHLIVGKRVNDWKLKTRYRWWLTTRLNPKSITRVSLVRERSIGDFLFKRGIHLKGENVFQDDY